MQQTQGASGSANPSNSLKISPRNYLKALKSDEPFYIQFNFFTPEVEAKYMQILHRFLANYDILFYHEMMITILRELITNAVKANTKRLYFKINNLNIKNKEEYDKGMASFKKDVYAEDDKSIFEKLNEAKLYTRVMFQKNNGKLRVQVINNTPIIHDEYEKIKKRVDKAYSYKDISDAFDDVLDDTEGTGLGLIMGMMLFKSAGFPRGSFKVETDGKTTIAILTIPIKANKEKFYGSIVDVLKTEIEKISPFKDSIQEIQRLSSDPKSTIKEISDSIKKDHDPAKLILKLAESEDLAIPRSTKTVEEAVILVGLKAIDALLSASSDHNIKALRYKKFKNIWKDSYRAAFYAYMMVVQFTKRIQHDYIYLATLLSDIGLVILLSVKRSVTKKIHDIAGAKIIDKESLLEEISLGISHNTLGARICEKWNFNEILTTVIEFHERPHMAPKKYKNLIYLVYLAYMLVKIEHEKMKFEFIDEDVLKFLKLTDKNKFNLLHNTLKQAYELRLKEIQSA